MTNELLNKLKALAEEILQLNDTVEVKILRKKSLKIYNKLLLLENSQIKIQESQVDIHNSKKDNLKKDFMVDSKKTEEIIDSYDTNLIENTEKENIEIDDLFIPTFDSIKDDMSQKEEFKDTISIEETERFFEEKRLKKEVQKQQQIKKTIDSKQLSLHDKLLGNTIQIGLNDRIAFVNNLFNFNQNEFNKVLGTIEGFGNIDEAINFINNNVKLKYNWDGKEDLEERFLNIIERKFL